MGSNGENRSGKMDTGSLSSHLWEAANILRGPVDAADFKTYIFPLLFFKRLSDVYATKSAEKRRQVCVWVPIDAVTAGILRNP